MYLLLQKLQLPFTHFLCGIISFSVLKYAPNEAKKASYSLVQIPQAEEVLGDLQGSSACLRTYSKETRLI